MSVDDTHIEDWSSVKAENEPKGSAKISTNLGAQFRNMKSAYRAESILKQWERPEAIYSIEEISSSSEKTTIRISGDATDEFQFERRVFAMDAGGAIARWGYIALVNYNLTYTGDTYVAFEWTSIATGNEIHHYKFGAKLKPPCFPSQILSGIFRPSVPQSNPMAVTIKDSKGNTVTLDPKEYTVFIQPEEAGDTSEGGQSTRTVRISKVEKKTTTFEFSVAEPPASGSPKYRWFIMPTGWW